MGMEFSVGGSVALCEIAVGYQLVISVQLVVWFGVCFCFWESIHNRFSFVDWSLDQWCVDRPIKAVIELNSQII
jgi:hypothetical protein